MATYKQKFNKRHGQPLDQSNSIPKIAKLSGIPLSRARQIVEKGKAAYYNNPQSVRPQVKSATQWGIARLYSAVMGGKAAKVDAKELGKKTKAEKEKDKKKVRKKVRG
jgi:hypothetical protein